MDLDGAQGLVQPWRALGLSQVAVAFVALAPGEGASFTHSHQRQEEVYVALEGEGILLVDGVELPIARGDLVKVEPHARRALRAAPQARLLVLVAGGIADGTWPTQDNARYLFDDGVAHYDDAPPWAANDPAALARNAELAARRERSAQKRANTNTDDS